MSELEHKLKLALGKIGGGKVSRREFIQLALAAGFTVAAADMLYTGAARAQGKPGDRVVLRATRDCVIAFSACPQDITPINGAGRTPTDAHYEILPAPDGEPARA